MTWRTHWSITIKRSAKWGMHSHFTVLMWSGLSPGGDGDSSGIAGLRSCLIAGNTWLTWDTWSAKLFLLLLLLLWKHAMGEHRGKKLTTVMFVPWGKQLLFIPVAPKEMRHAYNQQGKEQAEGPVGAGVGGHSHHSRASLLKVTLSFPSSPSHVWQHAPCVPAGLSFVLFAPVYYGTLCCVCLMIYCFICSYHFPEELFFSWFIANAPNHLGRHLEDGKEPESPI